MIKNIIIKYGKILIPMKLVTPVIKFQIPNLVWAGHRKGYWYTYASTTNIAMVNKIFNINIQQDIEDELQQEILWKVQPYNHQFQAIQRGYKRDGFGYLLDPGLGKTKIIIDEAQTHAMNKDITGVLVICTKSMIKTWVEEIQFHGHSKDWRIYEWTEKGIYVIQPSSEVEISLTWFIINVDNLNFPKGFDESYNFVLCHEAMMVIDESTSIMNEKAQRTQAAFKIRAQAKYRRILTGCYGDTPMAIYSQLYFLNPEIVYGWEFKTFRNHFCDMGGFKNRQIVGYKNQEELAAIIANNCFTITKEECLDIPPKIYQQRYITLSSDTRKVYNKLSTQLITSLSTVANQASTVYINMALTRTTKHRQCTGGMILDDNHTPVEVGDEKLKDLLHVIEEGPGKTIIWAEFRHEITRIKKALDDLDRRVVIIQGDQSSAERKESIDSFEGPNGAEFIIIQNDTGSEGITLNAANTVIFFTNSWKFRTRKQSEDRCHRIGQTKSVTYIDLLVEKSIDITIYNAVKAKKDIMELIKSKTIDKQELIMAVLNGEL